jgi:serine/threonine protein kinase
MTPSSTIGHYRIVSKLGEGGMGAVYRATDTKLNRDVAIKVLPDALANDPDYLERFTREAQVLASLNHPNIATIHGVEDRALVMELVPGETLAERIACGAIPVEGALPIARQIAEALEAAHERGVIHRDLKPANVKVTPEGVVKVLDFGLAKAADPVAPASGANSPTLTLRATQAGIILGTAAYMAPEQAAGKVVDRRADIWSFGVTLYEMLTGKMLFTGETISHTLASVLKDPIDFALPQAPPPIRRLLAQCLERNPKERLRDIGDARLAIRDYLANPTTEKAAPPARARRLPWIASAVLLLALAGALASNLQPSPPLPVTRFRYVLGDGQQFTYSSRSVLAISPDGSEIAYVANRQIYLRRMPESEARPVPGTEVVTTPTDPAFSPDGKSIVYYDDSAHALKRIGLAGGAALTVCDSTIPYGTSWSEDGLVWAAMGKGILRIRPGTAEVESLVQPKANEILADPQMLPGGGAILFTSAPMNSALSTAQWDEAGVVVQSLKSGERKILVRGASAARYAPTGHLIYQTKGILLAAPFHLRRLELTAPAVPVVEGVSLMTGGAQVAVSRTGTLVYLPGPVNAGEGQDVLAIVDQNGDSHPFPVPPGGYSFPRVSRDGKHVTFQRGGGQEASIWVWDVAGESSPRLLTLPGSGTNRYPVWSADGQRVTFQSNRGGDLAIWSQQADGSGVAERLTTPAKDAAHIPDSWSPDGQTLSFTEERDKASEVWTYSLRDRKATVFAAEPGARLGRSVFSPDGHWVAYQAAAQPHSSIYVRPYPATGAVYLAPEDADSHHPVWSSDGKQLFYVAGPFMVGHVSFEARPAVTFGKPVRLPKGGFNTAVPAAVRTYDILPDGKHFLGAAARGVGTQGQPGIQVVLNWFEELKQRVSGN